MAAPLRLGHWFGPSPEFWLNLQTLFELRFDRQQVGARVEKRPKLTDRKHTTDSVRTLYLDLGLGRLEDCGAKDSSSLC